MTDVQAALSTTKRTAPANPFNDFRSFGAAIAKHFADMSKGELFRVDLDGDKIWEAYLAAFPEGSNPMFRKRTEHDGSYDRAFVRRLGNVVMIGANGDLVSIWDIDGLSHPYNKVAAYLSTLVCSFPIVSLFRTKENSFGYVSTTERMESGAIHTWYHFNAKVDAKHQTKDVDTVLGTARTTVQVMERGFEEITPAAVETVLDLMQAGNLYRGDEFRDRVRDFRIAQDRYFAARDAVEKSKVLWTGLNTAHSRIRNTVIGQLLQDLSEGKDLEHAVGAYERMTAPANYKRPTALVTKGMIDKAVKTIRDLGLEPSLDRRLAVIGDLSVNNVLWVNNQAQAKMKDGLTDLLMGAVKTPAPSAEQTGKLTVDAFMNTVLPLATKVELFLANTQLSNLMTLTAPVHPDAPQLFAWGNGFGWSYNGNVTDSISEKVKAAGGNVEAALRFSLAWFNTDDLDLHVEGPEGHVYFGQKSGQKQLGNGQILDVDMNVSQTVRDPVENLAWRKPADGKYMVYVNQYRRRETIDVGFTIEYANGNDVRQFSYHRAVMPDANVLVARFVVKNQLVHELEIGDGLVGQGISQDKWGLKTEQFVNVSTVLNSPNHWDGEKTGNKHIFFILDGCANTEPVRGIFNEYLKPALQEHRKVFEVLGNKTKCEPTAEQLSGLGFSSTKRDKVLARVTDRTSTRLYEIHF